MQSLRPLLELNALFLQSNYDDVELKFEEIFDSGYSIPAAVMNELQVSLLGIF